MKKTLTSLLIVVALLTGITLAQDNERHHGHIKRVLLIQRRWHARCRFRELRKGYQHGQ